MEVERELKEVKQVLRALVVSSATAVDARALLRDYRSMQGAPLPVHKFGYRDPLLFLRERCGDSFVLQGSPSNPVLTLIVPEELKHIDAHVQKQKVSSTSKHKGKRRSIPQATIRPPEPQSHLIANSFMDIRKQPQVREHRESVTEQAPEVYADVRAPVTSPAPASAGHGRQTQSSNKENEEHTNGGNHSTMDLRSALRKRLPFYSSSQYLESEKSQKDDVSKVTSDSGRQTSSSSSSSSKHMQLEELKQQVQQIIADSAAGVRAASLLKLYRQRYGRELDVSQLGFASVLELVTTLCARVVVARPPGYDDWLLRLDDGRLSSPSPPPPARHARPRRAPLARPASREVVDPEDALPGIDFDPDVFPADCMHYLDSVPRAPLAGLQPSAMVGVIVGEVYSPSHFWLLRLGPDHYDAMDDLMDQMTTYYTRGEGRDRRLSPGAARAGHYCASLYEGDWHRALVVASLDCDTVKVRHVDYGTVDRVAVRSLKPLPRRWAALPAQAVRARLAGVRPSAAGRRWPRASCAHFLRLVQDRRLVANVVAVDHDEEIVELLLIDTSTERDVSVGDELVCAGHADQRSDSALATSESHLFPRFEALESGATPNYAEIHAYLRDGIALDCVEAYRRHVPAALPPPSPPASPAPPSPPASPAPPSPPAPSVALVDRVSLFPAPASAPARHWSPPLPPPPSWRAPLPHANSQLQLAGACAAPPFPHAPHRPQPCGAGRSPPPPAYEPPAPVPVGLPAAERQIYQLLARVDPYAAHWYMMDAYSRSLAVAPRAPLPPPAPRSSALDPLAREFRQAGAPPAAEAAPVRPPPGFGN